MPAGFTPAFGRSGGVPGQDDQAPAELGRATNLPGGRAALWTWTPTKRCIRSLCRLGICEGLGKGLWREDVAKRSPTAIRCGPGAAGRNTVLSAIGQSSYGVLVF